MKIMEKINLNPIEKVYYSFYISKKERMYFNEIREKTKMSISSLQNVFIKLEKSGKIIKIKEKANTFYTLKNKNIILLHFTNFDIQRVENLNRDVRIPLKEFIDEIKEIAFIILFGSASIKQEKKGSDIDLLIVMYHFENNRLNNLYQKEIKKRFEQIKKTINSKSLYPLSLVFIDEEEFKTRKDYLLNEAKKTGFCIYNQQHYYGGTLKNEN